MNDKALAKLDAAQHALAECKTVMEAKQIADVAEAARVYLERTHASAETVNRAAEIRTLAERQMGAFLKQMPKAPGGNPNLTGSRPAPVEHPATLAEIGISKKQSSTAQKLAGIPEPEFRERIENLKGSGARLTSQKVLQPIERPMRRVTPTFNLKDWKRHTATMLDLRFRDVPATDSKAAVGYVTEFIQRYLP